MHKFQHSRILVDFQVFIQNIVFRNFKNYRTEHKSMRSIWSSYSIRWRGSRASIIRVGALSRTNTEWAARCARSAPPKLLPTERSSVIRYDRLIPRLSAMIDWPLGYLLPPTEQSCIRFTRPNNTIDIPDLIIIFFFPQFLGRYVSTQTHSSCINNGRLGSRLEEAGG